jgi:hypothetical protein
MTFYRDMNTRARPLQAGMHKVHYRADRMTCLGLHGQLVQGNVRSLRWYFGGGP